MLSQEWLQPVQVLWCIKVHTITKIHGNHLEAKETLWVVPPNERSQGCYVENTTSSPMLQWTNLEEEIMSVWTPPLCWFLAPGAALAARFWAETPLCLRCTVQRALDGSRSMVSKIHSKTDILVSWRSLGDKKKDT